MCGNVDLSQVRSLMRERAGGTPAAFVRTYGC